MKIVKIIALLFSMLIVFEAAFLIYLQHDNLSQGAETNVTDTSQSYNTQSTNESYNQSGLGYDSYSIIIDGTTSLVSAGSTVNVLSYVSSLPAQDDWHSGDSFRIIVTGIDSPSGASYKYSDGDSEIKTSRQDNGLTYTVHYELQANQSNGGGQYRNLSPRVTAEKNFTVYSSVEHRDELGTDEAFVESLQFTDVSDGTAPWDGDDAAGNDISDSNGVIRTFDSASYNLLYSMCGYDDSITYSNAWIAFEFTLRFHQQEVTFDTESMNWMSDDSDHAWKITTSKDESGNDIQKLTCWKRISNDDSSNSVIPGTGEVYCNIRVYAAKNGTQIIPEARAWMIGNSNNSECSKHGKVEAKHAVGKMIIVSAAPSYNVFISLGSYMREKSSVFDFSTGNDLAPNKSDKKIHGRLMKYSAQIELRNKVVESGRDKGKDKKLKGIEIPSGKIKYSIKLDTSYLGSDGKTYNTSNPCYTPILWAYDGNGSDASVTQGRDLSGISITSGNAAFGWAQRKISEQGLLSIDSQKDKKTTWCNGKTTISQSGNILNVSINDYEINPMWFPSSMAHAYQASNDYWTQKNGVWNTSRGIFNSINLYVVIPYGEGDDYLPSKYGTSGTISASLTDYGLSAQSLSGQKLLPVNDASNQARNGDDFYQEGVYVSRKGSYWNTIWYSLPGSAGSYLGTANDSDTFNHGNDTVILSDTIAANAEFGYDPYGEEKEVLSAADVLLKFDSKLLEIDTNYLNYVRAYGGETFDKTIFYASKKDGTDWVDDTEMNNAHIEDLIYYDSLDKLKNDNKRCVATLVSFRNPNSTRFMDTRFKNITFLRAINNQDNVGKVAQIVSESNSWKRYSNDNDSIDMKQTNPIPLITQVKNPDDSTRKNYYDGNNRVGKNYRAGYYIKAEYDSDGNFHEHTSGVSIGDSLHILNHHANVSISVEQESSDGSNKSTYDLDNNQYIVDYGITPSIKSKTNTTTTLYITAVLPKGLTYEDGTSIYGGNYIPSSPSGSSGKINNGEETIPNLSTDDSGNTVISWTIRNAHTIETIPVLHFSAKIDQTASRNQSYTVTTTIKTDSDRTPASYAYGNKSDITVTTSKTTNISVIASPDSIVNDSDADISYTLKWINSSSKTMSNQLMLVTMPSNNDSLGSKYSGSYTVSSASIKLTSTTSATNYKIYATNDSRGYLAVLGSVNDDDQADDNKLSIEGITAGSSGGCSWHVCSVSNDGTIDMPSDASAFVIIGDIRNDYPIQCNVSIKTLGNKSGDTYAVRNALSKSFSIAKSYIAFRVMRGVTWVDWNANGKRDEQEARLSGLLVELLYENGTNVPNADGAPITTITGNDGSWMFSDVPAGEYKIRFTGAALGKYTISPKNAIGVNKTMSSKADGIGGTDGTLHEAIISNVSMPSAGSMISSPYIFDNLDAGFVPKISLPLTGGTGAPLWLFSSWFISLITSIAIIAFMHGYSTRNRNNTMKSNEHTN